MTTPFAPALSRASTTGKLACRAKTVLALALLTPLAACAVQPVLPVQQGGSPAAAFIAPAAPAAAATPAAPAAAATPAAPAAVQPPAEQAAPPQAGAARPAAPARTAPPAATAAPPATTAGEVPAAATPANPAQNAATPATAPAATPATQARPAPIQVGQAAAGPSAGTLLQTILALALVLALLAALAWAMKRYGPKMSGGSANLRMVGALNIGGRERIMVVEVGDQWIVVGASPGRVNALATMPKGETTQATASLAGHGPSAASFADWLKQTIDKRNAK